MWGCHCLVKYCCQVLCCTGGTQELKQFTMRCLISLCAWKAENPEDMTLSNPAHFWKYQPRNITVPQLVQQRKGKVMRPWLSLMYSFFKCLESCRRNFFDSVKVLNDSITENVIWSPNLLFNDEISPCNSYSKSRVTWLSGGYFLERFLSVI